MVDNRMLEEISTKIINYLKHIVYRKLKLQDVSNDEKNQIIVITLNDLGTNTTRVTQIGYRDFVNEEEPVRRIVEMFSLIVPVEYQSIKITDILSGLKNLNYNFSLENIPESFQITKIPYKQLKIKSLDREFFLNVCVETYQRILSLLSNNSKAFAEITFTELTKNMKRKEIVTLLLSLSN